VISKIISAVVALVSGLVLVGFIFVAFVASRQLPPSANAPQVGQKAPEFNLVDVNNKPVSLTEILSQPVNGKTPKGALLVFYRGYW
jgi:cytochrome oxidase Cu insertion factor (SCO1/SenC/PrrC family)